MRIGTLNVKNVETNATYVREMLKSCDILAIQEHWLFNFQLPSHYAFGKAVDENTPCHRRRSQEAMVGCQSFEYQGQEVALR